jgi:hypothetical protein
VAPKEAEYPYDAPMTASAQICSGGRGDVARK